MALIVKNTTVSKIRIGDLYDVGIDAGQEKDLEDLFSLTELMSSTHLKSYITSGDLALIRSSVQLDPANGLELVSAVNEYTLASGLSEKANINHSHNDLYYTKSEVDTTVSGVQDIAVGAKSISFSFYDASTNGHAISSNQYQAIAKFYYPGKNEVGQPKETKVIANVQSAGQTGYVQFYDYLNSNSIGIMTFTNTSPEILTFQGATCPDNETIIEIRGKVASNQQNAALYAITIKF